MIGPGFPAEPWNTYSSFVIVIFGLASLALVARRTPRAYDLYALCALLILNGVGSSLWHGLRTRWSLTFDVLPALVFLLAFIVLWSRRISPFWQSLLVVVGFFLIQAVQHYLGINLAGIGIWVALAPAVILVAVWLILRTAPLSAPAALFGAASLATALVALLFRTIDGAACPYLPAGTHFLWHILLSSAAFLGLVALTILSRPRTLT
jgi:hypothetical protein